MSLPVLKLLESQGVPYSICARPWAQDLLSGMAVESFIPITGKFFNDVSTLRKWHRKNPQYHRGLLLPDSLSSALLFRLSGFRSAGYRDDGRGLLLSWPRDKPTPRPHAVQSWFDLAQQTLNDWRIPTPLGAPAGPLDLPLTAHHRQKANAAIARAGLVSGDFVLIAPTATGLHRGQIKVWPHFAQLTVALQSRGVRVVMCPPATEQQEAKQAAPSAELLEPLGLGAFTALTRLARLVVCNDSGASHLSAAVQAQQITLFGVTDPARTAPWTTNSVNLGQNGQWPSSKDVIAQAIDILARH